MHHLLLSVAILGLTCVSTQAGCLHEQNEYTECLINLYDAFDTASRQDGQRDCCLRLGQQYCELSYLGDLCRKDYNFLLNHLNNWHEELIRANQSDLEDCYRHTCYKYPFYLAIIVFSLFCIFMLFGSIRYFRLRYPYLFQTDEI